jgi:hypothetical protein
VKIVPEKIHRETRTLFWIERSGSVLVWQRPETSRFMPGFWELPEQAQLPAIVAGERIGSFRHCITFHSYTFDLRMAAAPYDLGPCRWVEIANLGQLAISTVLRKALRASEQYQQRVATVRSAVASA